MVISRTPSDKGESASSSDAPTDAASFFAADPIHDVLGGTGAPSIVYPSHETMFPLNLGRVLHQWNARNEYDLFEVRFDSATSHLRFYTTDRSYLVEESAWTWLAASNASGSVTMSVRAVQRSMPSVIARSHDVTLHFAASEVIGALSYWSTGAQGVMRATISTTTAMASSTRTAAHRKAKFATRSTTTATAQWMRQTRIACSDGTALCYPRAMISPALLEQLLAFRKEREWEQFHNLRTLSTSIALESAELLEHTQWAKDTELGDIAERKRGEITDEIADVAILLSYLAHDLGIDLEAAVTQKMQKNAAKYPVDKAKGRATKYDAL